MFDKRKDDHLSWISQHALRVLIYGFKQCKITPLSLSDEIRRFGDSGGIRTHNACSELCARYHRHHGGSAGALRVLINIF